MVVMSMEAYEKFKLDFMIYEKLKEAATEAKSTDMRYDFDEVSKELRGELNHLLTLL